MAPSELACTFIHKDILDKKDFYPRMTRIFTKEISVNWWTEGGCCGAYI